MNPADKKKLVAEILATPANFELSLSDENRQWFVDRLIRSLETGSPATPDAAIPGKVRDIVPKAKAIATAKAAIKLKIPLEVSHKGWHGTTFPRRIEIIYGAIANDPSLAESANDKQLDLVIRRRYRTVARMDLWVNSGSTPPLFQYPDAACPDYRINAAAVPSWNVATPHRSPTGETLPRWTLKIAGAAPVAPALENLWTSPTAPCEGNVLECATALSSVLFDSLLEVQNPETFLRALNGIAARYLAICNPTLLDAAPNFILDPNPRHVFTAVHGPMEDLQVGDYVYIWNHSLYPLFQPTGVWVGEHAVVTACHNRDPLTGFKFSGHGVPPSTLSELQATLLQALQTFQHLLYAACVEFLAHLAAGATVADVIFEEHQLMVDGQLRAVEFYLFNRRIEFSNYMSQPASVAAASSFLFVYFPSRQEFRLHRSESIPTAVANPFVGIPMVMLRSVPPADQFDPVNWGISYNDVLTGAAQPPWPLFRRDNGVLTVNLLRGEDMPNPPLSKEPGHTGVRMVQPSHRPTQAGAF